LSNSVAYTAGSSIGQTFGNFTWNNAGQSNYCNIQNSSFKVLGLLTVGPSSSNQISFANTSGTFTNSINSIVVSGGILNGVGASATVNLNVAGSVTVSGGTFNVSYGTGTCVLTIGTDLTVSGSSATAYGTLVVSNSSGTGSISAGRDLILTGTGLMDVINSSSSPSTTVTVTRDMLLSGTDIQLNLEAIGSSSGVATINVGRDFNCSSSGIKYAAIDFGGSTISSVVANNAINIVGNFTKSGNAFFQTYSNNSATGFVFNGSGTTQNFSYSGTNSDYTSYSVANGAKVQLNTNLTLGTSTGAGVTPVSTFTVASGGTLDFLTNSIIAGTTTDPKFITSSGSNLISSSTGGFGECQL